MAELWRIDSVVSTIWLTWHAADSGACIMSAAAADVQR